MPERIAFRMRIKPGAAAEYEKRHDEIFPELSKLLKDVGISDYSIWLDPETNYLFATLIRSDDNSMDKLPTFEVMQRWWAHMGALMDVHPDNVPVQVPLHQVFYLK